MKFLSGYNMKIVFSRVGGGGGRLTFERGRGWNKNLVGEVYWGRNFSRDGGKMSKFLASRGTPPIPHSRENPADMCEV